MSIPYTYEELVGLTGTHKLPLICEYCGITYLKYVKEIRSILKLKKNKGKFCSIQCQHGSLSTRVIKPCSWCGKESNRKLNQVKRNKSNNIFCSQSCAASYNNTHKKYGTRQSKLEKWLIGKLPSLYPDLEFHFGRKDTINSELDIYIPLLKLAFELNGIFHYEPIYGDEKLSQIKNNDNRKLQACNEQQIELCIIDVSKLSYFKEENALPYLEIINNIIESKLSL